MLKKDRAASNELKAAQSFDPEKPPKRFRGTIFGNNACTRKLLPVYIPDNWLAVSPYSRSALDSFSQTSHFLAVLRRRLVFVVVALPPPPVTFPATRLGKIPRDSARATLLPRGRSFPQSATAFLSAVAQDQSCDLS